MSTAKHGLANLHEICHGVVTITNELCESAAGLRTRRTTAGCTSCKLLAIRALTKFVS